MAPDSRKLLIRALLLCTIAALLCSPTTASAQLSDDAAGQQLATIEATSIAQGRYSDATIQLAAVADNCLDCSPDLQARTWIELGVVQSMSGAPDRAEAAFRRGFTLNPEAVFPQSLRQAADPDTVALFARVQASVSAALNGTAAPPSSEPDAAGAATPAPPQDAEGTLECEPQIRDVEALRPIPIHCVRRDDSLPPPARMVILYRAYNDAVTWKRVTMKAVGEAYQGTIPCTATQAIGKLEVLVRGFDANDHEVESLGDAGAPLVFNIQLTTSEPPPAFPGKAAPEKCEAAEQCPPGMPGCGAAGSSTSCVVDEDCASGKCVEGMCAPLAPCRRNSECESNRICAKGECQAGRQSDVSNLLSLEFDLDLAYSGGQEVCGPDADGTFLCTRPGTKDEYLGTPQPGNSGASRSNGLSPGTTRLLLGYERFLVPELSVGVRVGLAFGGGPSTDASGFLPLHVEVAGKYWLLSRPGGRVRAYVGLSGGVAQVDTRFSTEVVDCGVPGAADYDEDCAAGHEPADVETRIRSVDAVQRFGRGFVGARVGALVALAPHHHLIAGAGWSLFFPDGTGSVLQPSVGYVLGF